MTHKLALVGIGKIARDQHVPALSKSLDFELVATASRNASVNGVEAFSDLAFLLDARPDITCVSLCTPPQFRYRDAQLALEAGKHVMLEKPPGATLSEVHNLAALAENSGVSLFASWHSRHAAAVNAVSAWLRDKTLKKVEVLWKEDVRYWHPGQDWIWEAGGLGVFDPGINALSILTAILPKPVHLKQATLLFPENRDTPISAELDFYEQGGASVSASFDWLKDGSPEWDIHISTLEGDAVLRAGGAEFLIGGAPVNLGSKAIIGEYPSLYLRFAELLAQQTSDVDLAPMRHVADAFTIARRVSAPTFDW